MLALGAVIRPEWMFLAGCALLTFVMIRRTYRRVGRQMPRKGRSVPPMANLPRPQGPWDGACRDAAAHLLRQEVELHEVSRDLTGRLDARIVVLEQLVATSSRQIERMEQLLNQMDDGAHSH